jgi:PLP dependent protein
LGSHLSPEATALEERYLRIRDTVERYKAALIAVSKTQPVEAIESLYRLGHRDFGENYVQELVAKAEELEQRGCTGIRWHFLGHLQTNKVKMLLGHAHTVHSIDSLKLGIELSKRWNRSGKLPVFLEINIDLEESKSGVRPQDAVTISKQLAELEKLELLGLMCIPSEEGGLSGESFRRLRELEHQCRPWTQGQLSMGMSRDYEVALREGSTFVRIGTALFGARHDPE